MDEDVSNVSERLDSLWFFSNVFSTTTKTTRTTTQVSEPVTEEVLKPVSENQRVVEPPEETRGRGKNGKRGRSRRKRRVVLADIDLGFSDISKKNTKVSSSEYGSWFEENCRCFQKLGWWCLYDHYKNMPPLHDNIAMKEHLKSWAYAVACTVK